MFSFIQRPFLYVTPPICGGILLADKFPFGFTYTIVFSLLLLLIAVVGKIQLGRELNVIFLALTCTMLGGSLMEWDRPSGTDRIEETVYAFIEVKEIADSDREWRRSIVDIKGTYVNGVSLPANELASVMFNSQRVQVGDILAARLDLIPIRNKGNPGEFDSEAFWARQNVFRMAFASEEDFKFVDYHQQGLFDNFWQRTRNACKEVLHDNLPSDVEGLADALILGDKNRLSSEDRAAFSNSGAMHVLAVSGLHVGIVVYLLMFLFGRIPQLLTKSQAHILALLLVWVYAFLTGLSPSVQRAAFMFTLLVLAQTYGRRHDSLNILFFSAFVLLLIDPLLIYDIGFQLSYLAMMGILTLYRPISRLFYVRWKWLRRIWEGTAVGIAAQIYTVPLSLYYFHQFPNYFALSNLAVMLLAALILGLGILLIIVQYIQWFSFIIGTVLSVLLFCLLYTMQWIEDLPAAVATGFELSIYLVVLAYFALFIFIIFRKWPFIRWGLPIVFVLLLGLIQYRRYSNWRHRELIVFNHRQPVFCIKQANEIYCFYKDQRNNRDDAERLVSQYAKVFPGKISYIPLSEGETTGILHRYPFSCTIEKGHMLVMYRDVSIDIRTSHMLSMTDAKVQLDMPYLPYERGRISLLDGAYRFDLSSLK